MENYQLSKHAKDMMYERDIPTEWVEAVLSQPDTQEQQIDGTVHFIKKISAYGNNFLRVVIDPRVDPQRVVTLFFDRRLKRGKRK